MKILNIKIKKLFELFDYNIPLYNSENLQIITGPNGFGKTMILNIIYSLFNKRFFFFYKLIFKEITLTLEDGIEIIINRQSSGLKQPKILFSFFINKQQVDEIKYDTNKILNQIENYLPHLRRYDTERWIDRKSDRLFTIDDIESYQNSFLNDNYDIHFSQRSLFEDDSDLKIKNPVIIGAFDSLKVHIIKEQRLFRKVQMDRRGASSSERNNSYMTDTIREYAKELSQSIFDTLRSSLQISQDLDSSFPKRLLNETGKLSVEDFNERFSILKNLQSKLRKYGLSESEQEVPIFDQENAKVLLVYLNDTEKKLGVFDGLLSRLELFANILNERRFTYKSIKIDKEKGFVFLTEKGIELNLTDLSSGEQHEVVLLYELIFNAKQNTLVLIDEPEISLHITWQKEFLDDLLRIIGLQKMQVIVATHSPQIINGRWDLVYNLDKRTVDATN